ncbi:MAG: glycosyltransferase [Clostridia bacterium]|nr:glycosyltransferase [Clostridia bacterium]
MNKTIHYCWFGRGEKPKLVQKCIASWKKYCPDYEIVEWNEDNFDIGMNRFVSEAYSDRNYAFVSDFARAYVLYNYGGIYLDTDVELFKNFDAFLSDEAFLGFEEGGFAGTCVIGAQKGCELMKIYLDRYENSVYFNPDGTKYSDTNVVLMTELLEKEGLVRNDKKQTVFGITVYPRTYFSPYDYINGISYITDESVAVHHFAQLWLPKSVRAKTAIKKAAVKIIGGQNIRKLREKINYGGKNNG